MALPNGIFLFYSLLANSNIVIPEHTQKMATELIDWKYIDQTGDKVRKPLNFIGSMD